jgi:hypothetical protein
MTYREQVNQYLTRFGERVGAGFAPLDGAGHTLLARGSATIGVNVLEQTGVLVLLAPIMPVPARNQAELYRQLLELNMVGTEDAAFAIDREKGLIYVRAMRGLADLQYEEFVELVRVVGRVADEWDDKLRQQYG